MDCDGTSQKNEDRKRYRTDYIETEYIEKGIDVVKHYETIETEVTLYKKMTLRTTRIIKITLY